MRHRVLALRWVFIVNVPAGIAAFVLGVKVQPSPARAGAEKSPLPDLFGAALLTGSIAMLSFGLVKAPDWGWTSAGTLGGLAAAVLLGVWFVLRSAHHPVPNSSLTLSLRASTDPSWHWTTSEAPPPGPSSSPRSAREGSAAPPCP
ncbi:hypothetical protein [Streptomyces sp. NBC_00239]|uniref:hypothetical protein n=1 Tax=Streptomyces sp. NBC_00239 TaxID=2903640 RepID=UPI002E2CC019|nr:hypothetical protein [Streptomyces sp. NBC_00239]